MRLEASGELLSFAVPHGPSLDPAKKHLAVRTEDHPIEYLEFEDVIPSGEYGGGPMIAWDRGSVLYLEGPPEQELAQGKLHVELRGMKLRGRWAFVKLAKSAKGNEWLFFKKADEASSTTRDLAAELPRSVLSGLTVEELASKDELARKLEARARKLGAKPRTASLAASRSSPLATAEGAVSRSHVPSPPSTRRPPAVARQLFDAELGGVRVLAVRDGDVVTLRRWTADAAEDLEAFYPRSSERSVPSPCPGSPSTASSSPSIRRAVRTASRSRGAPRASATMNSSAPSPRRQSCSSPPTCSRSASSTRACSPSKTGAPSSRPPCLPSATSARRRPSRATRSGQGACAGLGIGAAIAKPHGSMYGEGQWRRSNRCHPTVARPHRPCAVGAEGVNHEPRDKVFWPATGTGPATRTEPAMTKGDLVDYYAAVADVLVPFLKDRPLILVRYPDGIEGKSFFQWNVPAGIHLGTHITVRDVDENPDKPRAKRTFLVDTPATLQYIADLACIPLHVLASRAPNLDVADFFTIDFDVKQSTLATVTGEKRHSWSCMMGCSRSVRMAQSKSIRSLITNLNWSVTCRKRSCDQSIFSHIPLPGHLMSTILIIRGSMSPMGSDNTVSIKTSRSCERSWAASSLTPAR